MQKKDVGKNERWGRVDLYEKLKDIPLNKRLEALLLIDMKHDRIALANQLGIPLSLVHIMLQHKDDILNHWKYSPSCNTHLSLFEIQTLCAAHQILLEWRCRMLKRSGFALSRKAILRKARYLKRLFDLKNFECGENWLQRFNRDFSYAYTPKYVNGTLDVPSILRSLRKELPGRVYEKFRFYWLVQGNKVLESDSDSEEDEAAPKSVANQQTDIIETDDDVAMVKQQATEIVAAAIRKAVANGTNIYAANNSSDSESDVEEVKQPMQVIEIDDDDEDDEPSTQPSQRQKCATTNSLQKEKSETIKSNKILRKSLESLQKEEFRDLLLDWKNGRKVYEIFKETYAPKTYKNRTTEISEDDITMKIDLVDRMTGKQNCTATTSEEVTNCAPWLQNSNADNAPKTKTMLGNVDVVEQNVTPTCSKKIKLETVEENTNNRVVIAQMKCTLEPNTVQQSNVVNAAKDVHLSACHLNDGDAEMHDDIVKTELIMDDENEVDIEEEDKEAEAQVCMAIQIQQEVDSSIPTNSAPTIQISKIDSNTNIRTAKQETDIAEQSVKPTCSKAAERIILIKEVSGELKHSLQLNTVPKLDKITIRPNFNKFDEFDDDVDFFLNSLKEENEGEHTTLERANIDEVAAAIKEIKANQEDKTTNQSVLKVEPIMKLIEGYNENNENSSNEEETVELYQVLDDTDDDENEEETSSLPQTEMNTNATAAPISIVDNKSALEYLEKLKLFAIRKVNQKAWHIIEQLDNIFRYGPK